MQLPLIDVFTPSYQPNYNFSYFNSNFCYICKPKINQFSKNINNATKAVEYILSFSHNQGLSNHITKKLRTDKNFKFWRKQMPSRIPKLTKITNHAKKFF